MRAFVLVVWCGLLLAGAAALGPLSRSVAFFGVLAGYEAVHIVAHLFLYGTLTALALLAGLSAVRAALLALGVGVLQEAVQLLSAGRGPGWPELFDLCVDGVAILGALVTTRVLWARRSRGSRTAVDSADG